MNKFLLSFSILILSGLFSSFAQNLMDGYYRVYNKAENRYIYVTDNTANDVTDFKAVQLIVGMDNAISNPASVLYVRHISDYNYDLCSQGTGVAEITGRTPLVKWEDRAEAYRVGVNYNGGNVWLGCNNDPRNRVGYLDIDNVSGDQVLWVAQKISADSDCYFGITPTIEIGGKYYESFYADFAFSFASEGMKAYYIGETRNENAKFVEITESIIPARTPVIIECSSANPSDNRLNLLRTNDAPLANNVLKGNYFCNTWRKNTATVSYDKETMRVLGKTEDGKLGFVVSSEKYLAANTAYLPVTASSSETINLLNPTDFANSIDLIEVEAPRISGVYSILGVKLRNDSNLDNLPAGIYIVDGKKVIKR